MDQPLAIIAVRVSPRPAENVRYSPELQEAACREWCAASGIEVVDVVQDILVSGGSERRFDSIFAALDAHPDTAYFVVSDSSRWTRDEPWRFWTIYGVLRERGVAVRFADQSEQHMNDDSTPFWYTLTTVRVEANYQERLTIRKKASAGVRRAWQHGKRWGHPFGWTWNGVSYDIDTARVTELYQRYVNGESITSIGRGMGVGATVIPGIVSRKSQREVVGDALWLRAQERRLSRRRAPRRHAKRASIYQGLLHCPWDGHTLQGRGGRWWHQYICKYPFHDGGWKVLSARRHVTPVIRSMFEQAHLSLPTAPAEEPDRQDIRDQIERLTEAWVLGRISQERYDAMLATLEDRLNAPSSRTADEIEGVMLGLARVDLDDPDPQIGATANLLMRELFLELRVAEDKTVTPVPREDYRKILIG